MFDGDFYQLPLDTKHYESDHRTPGSARAEEYSMLAYCKVACTYFEFATCTAAVTFPAVAVPKLFAMKWSMSASVSLKLICIHETYVGRVGDSKVEVVA